MAAVDAAPSFGTELKVRATAGPLSSVQIQLHHLANDHNHTGCIQTGQCLGRQTPSIRSASCPSIIVIEPSRASADCSCGGLQVANGISWLDDIQQFYRERSAIEKEHGARLNALAKRPPSFLPSQENKGPKNQWAGNPYGNASHRSRYLLAQIAVFPSKLPASITIMSAERNAPASAGASGGRSRVLARPTMGALANNMRKGRSIPDAS